MLPLLTFTQLLQNMAASVQGSAAQLVDLSIGSVLRAMLEACASIALWMQWLILQVLAMTRAATSTGSTLDSWMQDYAFTRLAGEAATGQVIFARYTPGIATTIPVGATVTTFDGTQSFTVVAQSGNAAWNGSAGYTLAALAGSVSVPVQANTPGGAGNVLPGAIGLLASPIAGVDTVSNNAAFGGGIDAESDTAFRARFTLYINSLSLGTVLAVRNALAGLGGGLRYAVLENQDLSGNPLPGNIVAIVDDGTGAPSSLLLANASAAVDAVRPIGTSFSVNGPQTVEASVQMQLETSNAATHASVALQVQQAVTAWIAQLPVGGTLALSKLEAIAHATDSSVISVTSTHINNQALDLVAGPTMVILAASIMVT